MHTSCMRLCRAQSDSSPSALEIASASLSPYLHTVQMARSAGACCEAQLSRLTSRAEPSRAEPKPSRATLSSVHSVST